MALLKDVELNNQEIEESLLVAQYKMMFRAERLCFVTAFEDRRGYLVWRGHLKAPETGWTGPEFEGGTESDILLRMWNDFQTKFR